MKLEETVVFSMFMSVVFLPRVLKGVNEEEQVTRRVRFRCLTPATMTRLEKTC